MTTMEFQELIKLGFNKNEAKVYISLIKFGKADASQIIKDTKFHKNIVYDNLEKLIDKGLATYIIEENKKVFQVASPDMLIKFFEEQEEELKGRKESAIKIAEEIRKSAKKLPFKQEAVIYRGIKGIKAFYEETLRWGIDAYVFGAPRESVDIMGETFWKNYTIKRIDKGLKISLIFSPSLRKFGESIKDKNTIVKYFDGDFDPLTETHITGDKVAIIVWSETPVLFLIKDRYVAESYKAFFDKMWKEAKS